MMLSKQETVHWKPGIPIPIRCTKCNSARTKISWSHELFGTLECSRCFAVIKNLAKETAYSKYQINPRYKGWWKGTESDPQFDGYFEE